MEGEAIAGMGMFLGKLLQIILVNIVLSGDNAVVIALACRNLPPHQRKIGILLGTGVAVALRIIFYLMIAWLSGVPFLKVDRRAPAALDRRQARDRRGRARARGQRLRPALAGRADHRHRRRRDEPRQRARHRRRRPGRHAARPPRPRHLDPADRGRRLPDHHADQPLPGPDLDRRRPPGLGRRRDAGGRSRDPELAQRQRAAVRPPEAGRSGRRRARADRRAPLRGGGAGVLFVLVVGFVMARNAGRGAAKTT